MPISLQGYAEARFIELGLSAHMFAPISVDRITARNTRLG